MASGRRPTAPRRASATRVDGLETLVPAVGQLEDLDEELHVHEPAGAELQVDAPRAFPPELELHARPHAVDLGALGVREPRAEHARPAKRRETPGKPDRPGPDGHARAPGAPEGRLAREVPVERAQRVRERRRSAALAEPQVHSERLARARDRREASGRRRSTTRSK